MNSRSERISIIIFSSVIIVVFLYLGLRDNSIAAGDLRAVTVTLKEPPKYDSYTVRGWTYRDIILTTEEYQRQFKITGMTYGATDHNDFIASVFAGDTVDLKVKSRDVKKLNRQTLVNNYNEVYGISKKGKNYIDLNVRTKLKNRDSRWAYYFIALGLALLPYGFIKGKPRIGMNSAVFLTSLVWLIIWIVFLNK